MQNNPFDISNMGLNQENPLFASMNMMRQMWESMASYPMDLSSPAAAMPSAEELDKRIKDLKAVENWLRLNLSMLTSTIQGLEIQRSTLSAFNSFTQSGMAVMPNITEAMAQASASLEQAADKPEDKPASSTETKAAEDNPAEAFMQSGQVWWNMMQQQFDNLAQATTQSLQQTQEASAKVAPDIPSPSADSTLGKKKATKKTAAKKTAAKKAAAKKTASDK